MRNERRTRRSRRSRGRHLQWRSHQQRIFFVVGGCCNGGSCRDRQTTAIGPATFGWIDGRILNDIAVIILIITNWTSQYYLYLNIHNIVSNIINRDIPKIYDFRLRRSIQNFVVNQNLLLFYFSTTHIQIHSCLIIMIQILVTPRKQSSPKTKSLK